MGRLFNPANLRNTATTFAIASIILVIGNAWLATQNEATQRVVNQRQQTIAQAAQMARVTQALLETIAKVGTTTNDKALTDLLERHGIKVTVNGKPAPATEAKP